MKSRVVLWFIAWLLSGAVNAAPLVNLKVYVHSESGDPIKGALVQGFFFQDQVIDNKFAASHHGVTNKEGIAELSGHEEIYVDLEVTRKGFYTSKKRVNVRPGKSREIDIVLRDIRKPIAMYVKRILLTAAGKRRNGEEFGYDFVAGDFVAPYGKGVVSDILITHAYQRKDTWNYTAEISIRFSNPDDGLIPFYLEDGASEYRSAYLAPGNGYNNSWAIHVKREGVGTPIKGNQDKRRNYYFRVRSKRDKKGNIISGYYGKIYGEFPEITYYLNPVVNDRNIEFDVNRNLFLELGDEGQITVP